MRDFGQKVVNLGKRLVEQPLWERPAETYLVRRWPDLFATCVATVFFWLSLTPSLVPRPWLLQGVIGGITAAIGYAVGSVLSSLFRWIVAWRPSAQTRARCWLAYWILSPVLAGWLISESADMQRQLRQLQGLPPSLTWHTPMIGLIAVALWLLILMLARTVRLGSSKFIHWLGRALPRPVAIGIGLLVSGVVVSTALQDVVFERGVIDIADRIAKATNNGTKDGIHRPTSRYVSGGPGSEMAWDDLGFQGRNFTGSVLSGRQITEFTKAPAEEPVRVYISSSAPEAFTDDEPFKAQAGLAVRELKRTGGFEREVLTIAGTTGSGWIDATVVESLEYMYGGNTATVAVQYSYLPSWVSFLVDKEKAGKATRALVDAVRAELDKLPAASRPKLAVTGESLGAYAVEDSYGTVDALLGGTDGALLLGVPNFSPIAGELRERRDEGSPVWRPEFEGGSNVRFAQFPAEDLRRPQSPWGHPRAVVLQNASDAIVWWSPDLLLERPQWLDRPLGPDITPEINWFPFVTFWQTTVDMAVSYGVQAPHGHRYGTGSVDGWAAVLPPEGWTTKDTDRLRAHLDARPSPY
ncbi:alpha/beta-hydrolase family protein [Streptomyces sp. TRM66268-LWL]|uniref:Alpha/beta-hydrolase family protein n=1 Tax=Streptomyces polyasparticus TaxID=2767826 RepID=A0ABR7SAI9_9ACTN|nr:alpha/beta-hydrolase family protein [Streptomyces polyasparticus]MBC9711992.1 alpha/beta-hydrolase family protein [Streptomyces polyasparticus]